MSFRVRSVSGRRRVPWPPTRMTAGRRHSDASPDALVLEAERAQLLRDRACCARRPRSLFRIRAPASAQSSSRSSGHSVTMTAASAPSSASSAEPAIVDAVELRPPASATGSHALHLGALRQQAAREDEARRLAHVVRAGLEREPEERDLLPAERAEMAFELADDAPLLELVDLDDRVQELEAVPRVRGELLQRERVLREARAAEADARAEERRADPVIEPDALGDREDVGAGRLADVRDLVDERDPRDERGVRGELDHLGRRDVRAHDGRVDALVQLLDDVAVGGIERADHDPVGMHEVAHGRALGRELGIRHVARRSRARARRGGAGRSDPFRPARCSSSPGRCAARPAAARRRPSRRRPGRRRRSASAACRRRRRRPRLPRAPRRPSVVKVSRSRFLLEELRRAPPRGSARRRLASASIFSADDVAHDDVVPEIGEAGAGDEADVAGAEDRDSHAATPLAPAASSLWRSRASSRSRAGRAAC